MDVCRKDGFLMTIERVENVREFCTQNVEHAGSQSVFEIIQVSKDCDGGLNFEEAIDRYKIESGGWICESVVEKTIQPNAGPTITSERDIHTCKVSDAKVLDILRANSEALQQFETFEKSLIEQENAH